MPALPGMAPISSHGSVLQKKSETELTPVSSGFGNKLQVGGETIAKSLENRYYCALWK
jgi:hypothetical protein